MQTNQINPIIKTAEKLSCALASNTFSDDKKDALLEILCVLENEANISASHSELIKIAYPLMIKKLNIQYGKGFHQAINAIIESEERGSDDFEIELNKQMEKSVLDAEVIK